MYVTGGEHYETVINVKIKVCDYDYLLHLMCMMILLL